MLAKVVFAVVVFGILMIGFLVVLNRWRASNHAKEAAAALSVKNENKPAQVGVRRNFDVDAPPLPASAAARTAAAVPITPCADGSPGTVLLGPDGTPMLAPSGAPMRACRDGRVIVPAIVEARAGATPGAAPPPIGVRTAPTGQQSAPPPSRYGGDVMLASTGGATNPSPPTMPGPATSPMQTLQMMQELLQRGGGQAQPSALPAAPAAPAQSATPASPPGSIGSLLTPSQTPMVQAAKLGDRSLLLPKGRTVDCSLSTRVVSDISGMATCVLTSNVYSDNGRVVLLERGSEAVGEYSSMVAQGQRRLFLLWTRVKTPAGVVINLNSPAADALGTSGLDGYVDNHWWERIGAAFMLSIVQDAIAYKTAEASAGGGGTAVYQNSAQTTNRFAEKVLDSTINIKPTIYKNQGDRATILVARDLDFGTVYALRAR